MKVQFNQQQQNYKPQFKGVVDTSLRYLATNQAVGANGVDFCSMVAPRTTIDFVQRGPAAGLETGRREIMGTVNDSCIGLFGAGAGWLIAKSLNKKFGLNVNNIFTAPETLNILAENKAQQLKDNKTQLDYIKATLENVKAYNPDSKFADKEGYTRISKEKIDEVAKYLDESLNSKVNFNEWTKEKTSKSREVLMNKITESTGAQSEYILESLDKKTVSKTNLKSLLNDLFIVSDSFNKDNVKSAFEEQIKSGKAVKENSFIKGLSKFMKTRSAMGFGIATAIGLSVQPLNIYLTKLKTGSDGFVGVEGRSKDKSNGFKALKVGSAAAFFSMILGTLNMSPVSFVKSPSKFMGKMAFNGKMPTINQLKGLYGLTIISRIFATRDKDELRESLTKDTLGYVSWLILGDIVNKLVADGLDKSTLNYRAASKDAGKFKRTFNGSLKSRDEVLVETLANNGIETTKTENGKLLNKKFNEMVKDLEKLPEGVRKATKKRLRTLNIAQVSGYLVASLVLGLGIPNLNIYITNALDKKRKAEQAKLAGQEQKMSA